MYYASRKRMHAWQSLAVIVVVGVFAFTEVEFKSLHLLIVGTPFLVITAVAAMLGDYFAGIVAILSSTICVAFIGNKGWHITTATISHAIEFVIASSIIYSLAMRSRNLSHDTASLEDTILQLEQASTKLQTEAKLNQKDIKQLKSINKQLQKVIDQIMQDKQLWASRVEKNISENDARIAKSGIPK